jgi:Ca2+/H+ antiporter, TMEM165/GDT1 family
VSVGPVAFATVFVVILGFEFADRTNFALIGLAARERPVSVWAGAAAAFVVTSALAVAIGAALLDVLGGQLVYLRLGGGLLLLAYAAYLLLVPEKTESVRAARSAGLTAFLLILLLELGDTTMILTMNFVFTLNDPVLVGVAAALGLITVAATACFIGSRLGTRIDPRRLERFVIVVLTAVGALTIAYALAPGLFPSF